MKHQEYQIVRIEIIAMEEIKDQQKLFSKLFVSPTSAPTNPHLILSMQFLKLLLDEAPLLTPQAQKHLLQKILGLFEIQPANSLLLHHHDSLSTDQTPLLTQIILACTKATSSRSQGQQFLSLLDSLLSYYPVTLLHISNLTKQLAIQFHEGKFQYTKTWFLHRVLQKYYGPKKGLKLIPSHVFFFYGCTELSTIHSFEDMHIKIKNEMGFVFSFYLLDQPLTDLIICKITTNRQNICIRVGTSICIENQNTKQVVSQDQSVKAEQWNRIIVNFSPTETVVFLNDEEICRQKALIKKQKDRELLQYSFGEQIVGFVTGIALTHKTIPPGVVKQMPSLRNWSQLQFLSKYNLQDLFTMSCFPFSTFEMRSAHHCFDIFRRIHSQIGENIILFKNVSEKAGFISIGGSQLLLPLFYLARFYNVSQYPNHLQVLLKIWLASLQLYPNSQKQQKFLSILGHHLEAIPQLLTKQCIPLLNSIYQKHTLTNKIYFLRHIGWSGITAKTNKESVVQWLNWLTRLYQNNKTQCLQGYGLLDVVYWLVIHLQNCMHECCPQHYISEARVLRQFSLQELTRLELNSKRLHFQAVENIAAVILQYYIIDQNTHTIRKLKGILRLLLHKYSTCLYRTILRIFKRQFPKFKDDKSLSYFFLDAGLVPYLAALAEKTVDPGLIAILVYLLLMISSYREGGKAEVVDFLSIVFKRMEEIYEDQFNPISHGSKKVRKPSEGTEQTQKFGDLMAKIMQNRQDMKQVAIILINFSLGVVEDMEINPNKTKIINQDGLKLLRYFMPIAGVDTRIFILQTLSSLLEKNQVNLNFCLQSYEFNELLILCIRNQRCKQMEAVRKTMKHIFQWQLKHHLKISQYYIFFKTLTKSQLNLTLLFTNIFRDICLSHEQFDLDQLLMFVLITTTEFRQSKGCQSAQYWELLHLIAPKISQNLNKTFNISSNFSANLLLEQLSSLPYDSLYISLFNLEMNVISEQDVTFLFDICLPKAATGCQVDSLFQQTRRRVYAFEIVVWSLLDSPKYGEAHSQQMIGQLLKVLKVFFSICLLKPELLIDKSFVRMIIFATSHGLCLSSQKKSFIELWLWIIQLIKQQSINFQANSYSDLIHKLSNKKLQPFLVQIFQTFLRPNNEEYLLPFQKLVKMTREQIIKFIEKELKDIMKYKSMNSAIENCRSYAFNQLISVFNDKIRVVREKIDTTVKKSTQNSLVKDVQRLFDTQSIGEQQTRISYLHQYQCNLRQYYSSWKKIWKRQRIYHHPYGLFMAQKNSPSSFEFSDTKYKNFRFKISKFSSSINIQPILEAQIIEPWHAKKGFKKDAKHELSSLVEMTKPVNNHKKKEGISLLAENFMRTLRGQKKKQQSLEYDVIWIKRGRKARGKLIVTQKFQLIFWYDSLRQEDSHLSFQKFHLLFDKQMVKKWRIDLINKINLRRYLMQWHALQIQLVYKKSLLFYFCQHNQASFLEQIDSIRNTRIAQHGSKLKLNKVKLYSSDNWYEYQLPTKTTQDWVERKMSTLEYLMKINQAGSRNTLDVSQYPVVPWVCQMSEEKQPVLRDLRKTMGLLGTEQRKKLVTEKYNAKDPFNPVPSFFFGTHYSSPGVVFNYLIRIAPFTDYCKNLQGGKFDIPDRLFASLISAWKSATSEVSDVRQLIPEFYYLPQCLINSQNLSLGRTQGGQDVNSVQLPPWAGSNPYFLVAQLRQMLESDTVSTQISSWIDLIFGVKQKGKEAIQNFNVYYYLTYEDYSHCLENEKDEVYKKSCQAQIVHFGQIPPQLFEIPHAKRTNFNKPLIQLYYKSSIELTNVLTERPLGILKSQTQILMIRRNQIQTLVAGKSPAIMTKCVDFNLQKNFTKKLCVLKKESAKTVFFNKYFIVYGFVTNQFKIFQKSNGHLQFVEQTDSKIQFMYVNQEESLLLIGCQSGLLHICQIQYQTQRVFINKLQSLPFPHAVNHISEHDGFFAITFGCYVAIYKIERPLSFLSNSPEKPFIRFFRSFENSLPIKAAYIADSPLYCLLFYDNAHLKVFSINGQMIKSCNWIVKSIHRMTDTELNSLFCIYQEGRLMVVSTPDLRCLSELQIGGAIQVVEGIVVYKNKLNFIECLQS